MAALKHVLQQRRDYTETRLAEYQKSLQKHLREDGHEALHRDSTCIYATGSGGRGEMGEGSDLDLFIVGATKRPSALDAVLIQAGVLRAMRETKFEDPSHDGAFLEPHSSKDFLDVLGSPEDDALNRFTPRMLLLLESRVILGAEAYDELMANVLGRYWAMAPRIIKGGGKFLPFMLVNDVVRYWRVPLLNHESRLAAKERKLVKSGMAADDIVAQQRLDRAVRAYKLRFARCLTCFGTIVYLLAKAKRDGHMSLEDAKAMVKLPPQQRLEAVAEMVPQAAEQVEALLLNYAGYLEGSAGGKADLRRAFSDKNEARARKDAAEQFAAGMFELVRSLGEENGLYRYCVI